MAKRADASYIKTISKILPIALEWATVPLFVLEKETHVAEEAANIRSGLRIADGIFTELMDDAILYSPSCDLLFLDKTIDIGGNMWLPYNYFYVSFQKEEERPVSINLLYPTERDKLIWFSVIKQNGQYSARILQAQGTVQEKWSIEDIEAGKFDFKDEIRLESIRKFMAALLVKVATVMRALGHSDLYPVERKGIQHRKVHAKKPWQRSDLSTIVYLNKLPTEQRKPKGGHHNSPHPHPRRGAWRRLSNKRFEKHPKYGDKIWIKPSWVGPKISVVQGITYKVL